jgi:hypothetical protein
MTKMEANTRFSEVAKLLGLETSYFSGTWRVRINGQHVGQMSAEAWLDHLRNCMEKASRS